MVFTQRTTTTTTSGRNLSRPFYEVFREELTEIMYKSKTKRYKDEVIKYEGNILGKTKDQSMRFEELPSGIRKSKCIKLRIMSQS